MSYLPRYSVIAPASIIPNCKMGLTFPEEVLSVSSLTG